MLALVSFHPINNYMCVSLHLSSSSVVHSALVFLSSSCFPYHYVLVSVSLSSFSSFVHPHFSVSVFVSSSYCCFLAHSVLLKDFVHLLTHSVLLDDFVHLLQVLRIKTATVTVTGSRMPILFLPKITSDNGKSLSMSFNSNSLIAFLVPSNTTTHNR